MSTIKTSAKFIGRDDTKKMIQHFEKHHAQGIFPHRKPTSRASRSNPCKLAYCAWFDFATIQDFINELNPNSDPNEAKNLGVRIYFGAHYDSSDELFGYNTVILVGTRKNGSVNEDLPAAALNDNNYALTVVSTKNLEDLDNARLCPPTCDCGETVLCDALGQPYDSSCSCPQPLKKSNRKEAKKK